MPNFQAPSSINLFFSVLAITLLVWVLRGLGLLSFIPGGVIWLLLFLSIGVGAIGSLQRR